jgi:CDGSH-type Zn-finger protein
MTEPTVGGTAPIAIDVQAGRSYFWCSCGKSKRQPFCDGAHKGSEFTPTEYKATETTKVWFCACKRSAKGVLCDGSHKAL